QNCAAAIGAGAAAGYLREIGLEEICARNSALNVRLDKAARQIKGVEIVGCPDPRRRTSITPFNVRGADAHQVAVALDEFDGVMVRSGMHCAHYWFNRRKIPGCVRASLHFYNTEKDVEIFADSLEKAAKIFGVLANSVALAGIEKQGGVT
ncbi:MAG: hypothetical protein CVT47_01600, partial [Thermoplasmata archaeon HGW-Thermoplasmata-2]